MDADKFKRKTVNIPKDVYALATLLATARGFEHSFSAYVTLLLRHDLQENSGLVKDGKIVAVPRIDVDYAQFPDEPAERAAEDPPTCADKKEA